MRIVLTLDVCVKLLPFQGDDYEYHFPQGVALG